MAAPTVHVRNLFVRLTSGPFDLGQRDEGAFVEPGRIAHRTLIDRWAGPMAFQLALVVLVLTAVGPGTGDERLVGVVIAAAAAAYGLVLVGWRRIPVLALDLTMPLAAALLVVAGVEGGELRLAVPTIAVVVGTCVFAQRPWHIGFAMTCFLGAGYAVVLANTDHGPAPVSRWIIVMSAVVSSGVFVHWLRSKVLEFVEVEHGVRTRAEAAAAELAELSAAKTDFLARMSHELRTPLNAVLGFTSILLDRKAGPITDRQQEYLEDVRSAGLHLVDLVDDVLDVAQVEAGQPQLDLAPVAVGPIVEDCIRMVRERATRGGVAVEAHIAAGVPVLRADGRKIRQALLNLVANAVRFTPPGGRVDIAARIHDGEVLLTVRDTGVGIAPADQERMFDRFEQAHGAGGGTGLGLALARRFVEQHGGRLTARSRPGEGATFTIALPARPSGAPGAAEPAPAGPPADPTDDPTGALYQALMARGSPANRAIVAALGRTLSLGAAGLAIVLAAVTPGSAALRLGIAGLAALALAVMVGIGPITARASATGMDVICLGGTIAISVLVWGSGSFADLTPLAYGWLICVAFAPWAGRHRYVEILFVGLGYAVVLAIQTPGSEIDRWLAVVGLFLVNGFVIRALVGKLQLMMFAEREARRNAEAVEEELEAATAHKDDFVASMSHELRTPLNAIIGFSEVVQAGTAGPLDERQAEYIDDVVAAGRHLLALIDDILELAKLDAGRVPLDRGDLDLVDLLERAVGAHVISAADRGIDVLLAGPTDPVGVSADAALLEHAVTRLVGRAVEVSPEGAPVLVRADVGDHEVVVTIDDRSAATPDGAPQHLFDSSHEWDERDGSGLTYALARRIVALHGGAFAVDATRSGMRCRLALPVAVPSAVAATAGSSAR